MTDKNELFKIEDRYCPICGKFVKRDTPPHRCSKKAMNKIDRKEEEEEKKEERDFDDKLKEFEDYYNPETFYENEEGD